MNYKNEVLRQNGILLTEILTFRNILSLEFELIEDNTIDIDSIEELNVGDTLNNKITRNKINELVQAVKQLNKEIKSIKEK